MESEGTSTGRLRILALDAEQASRERLSDLLRTLGYKTTPVSNSEKALVLLEPDQFDLLLVSCSTTNLVGSPNIDPLSETEGIALAQFARSSDPRLKIIFLAASDQASLNIARGTGVIDSIITKPFTIWDLEQAIEDVHRPMEVPRPEQTATENHLDN